MPFDIPLAKNEVIHREFAEEFLGRMGYSPHGDVTNETDFIAAVISFQQKHNIPETGFLDIKTSNEMLKPRCGVSEDQLMLAASQIWKWNNFVNGYCEIQYYIHPDVAEMLKMKPEEFEAIVRESFEYSWCQHTNLNLQRTFSPGTRWCINMYGKKLDGPSSVLAQCQLPADGVSACRLDVDITETYVKTLNPQVRGILLKNVLTHEIGHGLGLSHSVKSTALMAPTYSEGVKEPVDNDDIPRVQLRYNQKRATPLAPFTPTIPSSPPTPSDPKPPEFPIEVQEIRLLINGKWINYAIKSPQQT